MRGVSAGFLRQFVGELRERHSDCAAWSVQDVCDRIVCPRTAPHAAAAPIATEGRGRSYVAHVQATAPEDVGEADVHVACAWSCNALATFEALLEYSSDHQGTPFFSLDLFGINHHTVNELPSGWWTSTYKEAVGRCGKVMLLLTPWNRPAPLYEDVLALWAFACALREPTTDSFVHASARDLAELRDALLSDAEATMHRLTRFHVERARGRGQRQTQHLRTALCDTVGFMGLDFHVKNKLHGWLLDLALDLKRELDNKDTTHRDEATVVAPPEASAQLTALVGTLLWSFKQGSSALVYFREACHVCNTRVSPPTRTTALVHRQMGAALVEGGDDEGALECFLYALHIATTHAAVDAPRSKAEEASVCKHIGEVLETQGAHLDAIGYHARALALRSRALGIHHEDTGTSHRDLAACYEQLGDYEQARTHLQHALAVADAQPDTGESTLSGTLLIQLARVHAGLGSNQEALACVQQALGIFRVAYGQHHPESALAQTLHGQVQLRMGNTRACMASLHRALDVNAITVGLNHPATGATYRSLGVAYAAAGSVRQGIVYCKAAVHVLQRTVGPQHPETRLAQNHLGTVRQCLFASMNSSGGRSHASQPDDGVRHSDQAGSHQHYRVLTDLLLPTDWRMHGESGAGEHPQEQPQTRWQEQPQARWQEQRDDTSLPPSPPQPQQEAPPLSAVQEDGKADKRGVQSQRATAHAVAQINAAAHDVTTVSRTPRPCCGVL